MTKRALISVSDKTGIVDFAKNLKNLGLDIISTGGTKTALDESGIETVAIEDVTGFPEMMDDPSSRYPWRLTCSQGHGYAFKSCQGS